MKKLLFTMIMGAFALVSNSQSVTMSILGGNPDNCSNPLPNAGTYTASGTVNGKNAYYKGSNLQILWDGSKWILQAKDPCCGGGFLTCWENSKNTSTPPEGCWTASFGCFLIGMSGPDAYPTVSLSSSSRGSTNPTGVGTNIDYIFTFSGTINSLTASNFSISSTGTISGASITGVSQTSANVWKVTVNTGSGTGTIAVDLVNLSGASALICSLPVYGSTYTVSGSSCTAPTVPTVTGGSRCPSGASVSLAISGTLNDATKWYIYTGSCGGTIVDSTSTGSYSVSPSIPTTYYVRGEGNCVTPGSCGSATVTVNTVSAITSVTASSSTICEGSADTLTANGVTTGTGATLTWYTGAGGTGTNLGTGNPLYPTPSGNTTYFARLAGTCNTVEQSTSVTVNTNSAITSVTASSSVICEGVADTLTANGVTVGTGATLTWYTGTGGTGSNLGTGNPLYHTPTGNTTYYARLAGTCNTVEQSTSVTVNINSAITSATASSSAVCLGNADTLTANGVTTGTGATLNWYTGTGGTGSNLGTGNPLYNSPATSTRYYARLAGTCNTVEASDSVTVNSLPVISSITSSRNPTTNGYAPYQCADLTASATGNGGLSYAWSPPGSSANTGNPLNVCPTAGTTYTLTVTDGNGCQRSDTIRQSVVEGNSPYLGRILMCYAYPRRAPMTYNIPTNQVPQFLNAGATLGACNSIPSKRNFPAFYDDIYRIYPNPSSSQVTLEWFNAFSEEVSIELADMTGRIVKTIFKGEVLAGEINMITADLTDLPVGMYFMRYSSPSDIRINKVQLMR